MLKKGIKKPLKNIYYSLLLIINSLYDYNKFRKHYAKDNKKNKNKKQLEAWILQDKHRIEKAFTLPNPRPSFGKDALTRLIHNTVEYESKFAKDEVYYISLGAIKAYKKFHTDNDYELPIFYKNLLKLINLNDLNDPKTEISGYYKYQESDKEIVSLESLMRSRHSFRNFSDKKINDEILKEIVSLSITAPSVCNRQHWRIHFFEGEKKLQILSLQNGNTGFTDNIPMIAVISSELSAFYTPGERNQPYTDGGIFAMNLMYAIEAKGLKSCPLNWCNSFKDEKKLHKLGYIPNSEAVIVIIALGHPASNSVLAKSPRLDTSNFYKRH